MLLVDLKLGYTTARPSQAAANCSRLGGLADLADPGDRADN
jgi:hypothetical protein